jgi:hypothetical protein
MGCEQLVMLFSQKGTERHETPGIILLGDQPFIANDIVDYAPLLIHFTNMSR